MPFPITHISSGFPRSSRVRLPHAGDAPAAGDRVPDLEELSGKQRGKRRFILINLQVCLGQGDQRESVSCLRWD